MDSASCKPHGKPIPCQQCRADDTPQAQGRVPHHAADGTLKHYCSEGYCPDITDRQERRKDAEDRTSFVAVVPEAQGAAPLSLLVSRLIGYCECVDAIRDEGNDDCCDFRQAAATIDKLQAQLGKAQLRIQTLEAKLNLAEEAALAAQREGGA